MNNLKYRSLVYFVAGLFLLSFAGMALAVTPAMIRLSPKNTTITITVNRVAINRVTPVACEVTLLDGNENKIASKNTSRISNVESVSFNVPAGKSYYLVATPHDPAYCRTTSRRLTNLTSSLTVSLCPRKK